MRVSTILFITALLLCHPILWSQPLTRKLPSPSTRQRVKNSAAQKTESAAEPLPDAPGYPIAEPLPAPPVGAPIKIEYDRMEKRGDIFTLSGNVRIDYRTYTLLADKIVFDRDTGEADAIGHVELEGGPDDELITASHGSVNFKNNTGHFYDVVGSIGTRASMNSRRLIYTTANPFMFTGKEVIKKGPMNYQVIGGSMTSCRLPQPEWQILAPQIEVRDGKAAAENTHFKFLGVPVLYLPYVTHPVNASSRQTGFLIPVIGTSSTKGTVVGDSFYWAINRSMDATIGSQYFSLRGWSPNAQFRYRGRGEDFANFHLVALLHDRGLPPAHLNQGGQDILFSARHDFAGHQDTRAVATGEYLSSYVYREAFAESFSLAVASEVKSSAFIARNRNGYSTSLRFSRYQNFEGISRQGDGYYTPQIRILHLPSFDFDALDRRLGDSRFLWGFKGSAGGLSRSEPGFASGGVGRIDLYPRISYPMHLGGWGLRPEVAVRDTFYSRSRVAGSIAPEESSATVNRKLVEAQFTITPPVLMRDYRVPLLDHILGGSMRHTIAPSVRYRYVNGVDNFHSILRFDAEDVASDTNEIDYALTQRLFFRHLHPRPCVDAELPPANEGVIAVPSNYRKCAGQSDAWLSWEIGGKYFFNPTFGGAVTPFRRNVLDTTLDLTGVAFLGAPRDYSPIISRLKLATSRRADLEWDLDYDTKTGRMNASNLFGDYRRGPWFGSLGYATLDALNPSFTPGRTSEVTKYNLLRLLGGFGSPSKKGLSMGVNAGYDLTESALQYGGIQSAYNWDCFGLNIEYRRLALGSVRNENQYSFSLTLAGIGSAGNLRHAEQIF